MAVITPAVTPPVTLANPFPTTDRPVAAMTFIVAHTLPPAVIPATPNLSAPATPVTTRGAVMTPAIMANQVAKRFQDIVTGKIGFWLGRLEVCNWDLIRGGVCFVAELADVRGCFFFEVAVVGQG